MNANQDAGNPGEIIGAELRRPRVLVAGATGYLGGFVLRELQARGAFVRAIVRRPEQVAAVARWADEVLVHRTKQNADSAGREFLRRACQGMDAIFSAVGITRQKDGLRYMDVDYRYNRNLLDAALHEKKPARRFVYVASLGAEHMPRVSLIQAKERFVAELTAAPIDSVVLRPSGFFSDLTEFLRMAERGRAFVFGRPGRVQMNPIHGEDLARVCVDVLCRTDMSARDIRGHGVGAPASAMSSGYRQRTIAVGGPEILSHDDIARLAFVALNRPTRITHLPRWLARTIAWLARLLLPEARSGPVDFLMHALTVNAVGERVGSRRVGDFFQELVERPTANSTAALATDEGNL